MTSSEAVVKSVAKKLKYYMEVKRLEDGFDLSDAYTPVLDHPPLRASPTLQYDGLHDRSLKHYFSQPKVRVRLTKLEMPGDLKYHLHTPQERRVKKNLQHSMKKYHFLKSNIPEVYYINTKGGVKIDPRLIGFGASPKSQKHRSLKGGWPVLRTAPPSNISQGEAERLVNSATKILVATETVEHHQGGYRLWSSRNAGHQSAPRSFESGKRGRKRHPLTAKYNLNYSNQNFHPGKVFGNDHKIHSRRSFSNDSSGSNTQDESTQFSRSASGKSSLDRSESGRPRHFIKRPKSGKHRRFTKRPESAKHGWSREKPDTSEHKQMTVINMPEDEIRDEVKVTHDRTHKYEAGSQTDKRLLDEYDHMEEEVTDGPQREYKVYVRTGNRIGASTSADVRLTIYGEKGRTKPILLSDSKYNRVKFQQGKEDLFIVSAPHVGKMRKIKIGHDRPQLKFAWFLENVTICDMHDKQIYDFPCKCWLSGQDKDHRTYQVLPVDRERALIDHDFEHGPDKHHKNDSDSSSRSSSDSKSKSGQQSRKDRRSTQAKQSQISNESESESDSDASSSDLVGEIVIKMSASSPRRHKKELTQKEKDDDSKLPATVIQFKKKDSDKVEEEIVLDQEDDKVLIENRNKGSGYEKAQPNPSKLKDEEQQKSKKKKKSNSSVHEAASTGNLKHLKEILGKFPEMWSSKDENGWTALHLAAANGHSNIVKWLTSKHDDLLNLKTPTGYMAVHLAAIGGHISSLVILHAMGASVTCQAKDKQMPLHLASRGGHLETVKWLVSNGADLTAKNSLDRTPVQEAEEYQKDTVADFLRVWARDKSVRNGDTRTSLNDKDSSTSGRPEAGSHKTERNKVQKTRRQV